MLKVLLDTNAYSALRKGNESMLDALGEADRVYLSIIVAGELHYGFHGGSRTEKNIRELKAFISKPTVRFLNTTEETAEVFGEIKHQLKRKGKLIPMNDVWIAAQCLETGSKLLTFDRHFTDVEGLRIWRGFT